MLSCVNDSVDVSCRYYRVGNFVFLFRSQMSECDMWSASLYRMYVCMYPQDVKRKLSQQVMGIADRAAGQQEQMKLSIDELRSFFND